MSEESLKAEIDTLEEILSELEADNTRLRECLESWNDHFFSMTDESNWPDMQGDYFAGYNDAMEQLAEYCMEMSYERQALSAAAEAYRKEQP